MADSVGYSFRCWKRLSNRSSHALEFPSHRGGGGDHHKTGPQHQGFITALSQILFNVFPAVVYLVISVVIMLNSIGASQC